MSEAVVWHDIECGAYRADLELWLRLAGESTDPVLDVGAGTGRVALELARAGHAVIALERDPELAAELARRASGLSVEVICADACDFSLAAPAGICVVPMQTIQLLADRPAFLRCARAALSPGALLAVALLGPDVQPFEVELSPDVAELDGVRYASAPTALRQSARSVVLERRRTTSSPSGRRVSLDVIELAQLEAPQLAGEAVAAGFADRGLIRIGPTSQHAGSDIACFEVPR
jgi:SAM-dependent methyltransferase